MSRKAFLSLMGMYNLHPTLFDSMNWPTDFTNNDIESFKYELLTETAEMEVIYNNGPVMQSMIAHWSRHRKPVWDHLIETTQYEYDPIANWDRNETETETVETEGTKGIDVTTTKNLTNGISHTTGGTTHNTGTVTIDNDTTITANGSTTNSGTDTVTHSVNGINNNAADNSMAVKDRDQTTHGHVVTTTDTNVTDGFTTTTNNLTNTNSGTVTGTDTETGTVRDLGSHTDDTTTTRTRTYRGAGNVGTMTSQQMINEERGIAQFDIMEYIINDFKNRFLLLIY